jgi:chemotaxis protein MotB
VLDTIIGMLSDTTNQIKIVGHTDTTPPVDTRYANNWELSTARAQVIADYMMTKGIKPERLIVTGRGEYEPIFPNDTAEHKALNSRADIIVVYSVEKNVINSSGNNLNNP